MHELSGGCHCGAISLTYRTRVAPEDAKPRACQCSFCRKHNSSAITDPSGDLEISVRDATLLNRYRFGLRTADFLVCGACGVYVAAFMPGADDTTGFATLMSSTLDARALYAEAAPVDFAGEDEAGRRQRRREQWTPARLRIAG